MPDQFTEISKTGYGKRIGQSIGGILVGLVLFIASFAVLFWNEGRFDLSNLAKTAVEIDAAQINTDSSLAGKLISGAGKLTTGETIGDDLFLKPGNFLAVKRTAEMYAWMEETEGKTEKNLGGSETTQTTYNYVKEWTDLVPDSAEFKHPEDHENPEKTFENLTKKAGAAKVGAYDVNLSGLDLPSLSPLALTAENTVLLPKAVLSGNYIYIPLTAGAGDINNPQVGDQKISYSVLRSGVEGTIFGKLNGDKIASFADKNDNALYRFFAGSKDQAIETLHSEFTLMNWILRIIGFLMMLIGLNLILAPLSVLLDVLPFLGSASRFIVGLATFAVALVLSVVTIIVSKIAHNVIALIVVLAIVVGVIVYLLMKAKNKKAPAPQAPAAQ